MATPLYTRLKENGISTYVFPSAVEDISQAAQNELYSINFTYFALLNLDEERIIPPKRWNFTFDPGDDSGTGFVSAAESTAETFSEKLVESLRNYVANKDETLRNSNISPNEFYYDQNVLSTPAESIFFSWLKKLGLMEFEVADGPARAMFSNQEGTDPDSGEDWTWRVADQFDDVQGELRPDNDSDPQWFRNGYWYEVWWKEREVIPVGVATESSGAQRLLRITKDPTGQFLDIVIEDRSETVEYLRVGDFIEFTGTLNENIAPTPENANYLGYTGNQQLHEVVNKITVSDANSSENLFITTIRIPVPDDAPVTVNWQANYATETDPLSIQKYYKRVVEYVGEIVGVNNTQSSNTNVTQIFAEVPEQAGATPKILFRTVANRNYRPGISFPFLPSQWEQTTIQGAESQLSPINTDPADYPGNKFAQFDQGSLGKWQYQISQGDIARRTGDFFGVNYINLNDDFEADEFDQYQIEFDGSNLDGISVEFNTFRYTDISNPDPQFPEQQASNFTEFSSIPFGGDPPRDFEFNAILWYYTVVDRATGEEQVNLYAVSFYNDAERNCNLSNALPTIHKYAPKDDQDGIGFTKTLNINYGIINEPLLPIYDPNLGHNIRDFNIFSQAIERLGDATNSIESVISQQESMAQELNNLRALLYTQTTLEQYNQRINFVESLFNQLQSLQIIDSDSISVQTNTEVNPPVVQLNSIDPQWNDIGEIRTTVLFDPIFAQINPYTITVPRGKSFRVSLINNDQSSNVIEGSLLLELDKDFQVGQSMEMVVFAQNATQNKKLSLRVKNPEFIEGTTNDQIEWYYLLNGFDLPVDLNTQYTDLADDTLNGKSVIERVQLEPITQFNSIWARLNPENEIIVVLDGSYNYFATGDTIVLNGMSFNQFTNTTPVQFENRYDLSGQLPIKNILRNFKGSGLGELDEYLQLTASNALSSNAIGLIFDYEEDQEFIDLIAKLGNNDITRLDQRTQSSQSRLSSQFQLAFNYGYRVVVTKTSAEEFINSFHVEKILLKNFNQTLNS